MDKSFRLQGLILTTYMLFSLTCFAGGETDFMDFEESASISTPDSGYGRIQVKTDGKAYCKDDAGLEHDLTIDTEAEIEAALGVGFGTSKAVTSGYIWVADGTDFESVIVSDDATMAANGALTLTANSVDSDEYTDDSIDDEHINWGMGALQVNSDDIPDHNGHSVLDTFNHILNRGKATAITISEDGGLDISWTSGEIYDQANQIFVATDSGSGTVTNNIRNYLKWVSGTALTLNTTYPSGDDVLIATFCVYDGNIDCSCETVMMNESVANIRRGLRIAFPVRVISGMAISEDTDVTNALDVQMDAGSFWRNMTEPFSPSQILTRTTNMVRHFHTAGVWDSDTNAEIDTTNYNNPGKAGGQGLEAIPANKWVKAYFIYQNAKVGWIYPTAYYNNEADAFNAPLSAGPPGLNCMPKLAAIAYKQGDASFANATWQDIRPGLSEIEFATVTDHGALDGLTDDDHPQYVLANSTRPLTANWDIGNFDITLKSLTGDGTIEGATITEGGTGIYNITESDAAYQPLEATLTDIADGTINENLVNTAFPWADNEVSDTLTSSVCTGNAATVTNATLTTALTVNTGTVTLTGNVANTSALTLGAGASSVSGSNTGDNAGTDDQTIDVFSIAGNNVQLSLESDGEATKTVDISTTTAVTANTAKNTNVSTALSVGTVGINTVAITSDGGVDDVTLPAATVAAAGMLTTAKWAEIVANTAKTTNATHTGEVTGSGALALNPICISGKANVTSNAADYILLWDATDSALKKCDMGELFGSPNLDGGLSDSNYGGITGIDGGTS